MIDLEQFRSLPMFLQDQILNDTFDRFYGNLVAIDRDYGDISLQNLIAEERERAIAARMNSKPRSVPMYHTDGNSVVMDSNAKIKTYTGKDVADIFILACRENGFCYYPLRGKNWNQKNVRQLYLFVKGREAYSAYARFDIDEIVMSPFTIPMYNLLSDISPIVPIASVTQIALKISNVKTENLPSDFVSVASANTYWCLRDQYNNPIIDPGTNKEKKEIRLKSIFSQKGGAFRGSSPNIDIL